MNFSGPYTTWLSRSVRTRAAVWVSGLSPRPFRAVGVSGLGLENARHIPRGSIVFPFGGLPYRIPNMNHKKELLWSL